MGAVTVVSVLAVLLVGLESNTSLDTVAVLTAVPTMVGETTIVIATDWPLARSPRETVTLPVAGSKVPWLAETTVAPTGSVSITVVPVAVNGPLLVTVRVYVRFDPTVT